MVRERGIRWSRKQSRTRAFASGRTLVRSAASLRCSVAAKAAAVTALATLSAPGAGSADAAVQVPTPTNVRVTAHVESLSVSWRVTSAEGLGGFRVRWRPTTPAGRPWSVPVELRRGVRRYTITGLSVQGYEVAVRAVRTGGALGGAANPVTGTPLRAEEPKEEEPPPRPPPGGMWVGINAGGWGPEQYADVKSAVGYVRLDSENPQTADISGWTKAGVKVIDDISGPYGSGGVKALNVAEWVRSAVAWVKANPAVAAVEVLNEPGGQWFWGPEAESVASEAAYAKLLKAVHEAFVANFGNARPLILGSYDGGHDSAVTWGEGVWNTSRNGGIDVDQYVDGVTVHPYGGTASRAISALGARSQVTAAHAKTGKPVYVTEVGWSTALGRPDAEGGLQWSETEQADNIYNFVTWARSTGYVAAITIYGYRDWGTNEFYGLERWGNPTGRNGSRKPAYTALREAAAGQPLSLLTSSMPAAPLSE